MLHVVKVGNKKKTVLKNESVNLSNLNMTNECSSLSPVSGGGTNNTGLCEASMTVPMSQN